jgi:fermentation-respiration switch protein FrsA (DUF1100 family)
MVSRRAKSISLIITLLIISMAFFNFRKFETSVIFHPVRHSSGNGWSVPTGVEEVWFTTSDNVRLNGWFFHAKNHPAGATVIYFHGNGGNISNVGWVGESLTAYGLDVLLVDYRGYGRSEGEANGERELNLDGDAAYEFIVKSHRIAPERLVLYGQSLGTTVAVDIASRKPCAALVLESGLSSASDMAAHILPSWVPRALYSLGRNRLDSASKLPNVTVPILITHGDPDPVIPLEQGRKLYAVANDPKKLLIYPGGGHNLIGTLGMAYLETVSEFIHQKVGPK